MANQYDTNLKLQAIADAIGDSSSSGLISALEDIADAVAGGGGGGSSTAGLVSDNFSETDTYDLGDYCIHNNTLYVCINAITTPGSWDLSDWQATNAGLQLSTLNSAFPKRSGVTAHNIADGATSAFTPYTVPQTCLGYFQIQSNGSASASIRVNGMAFLRNLLASPISVMFTLMQGDVIDITGTAANAYINLYY